MKKLYTFSSGNWFAVIIKDNNIGKVIGEPTGNQPSSYGDILSFETPNSGFMFSVSYKKFIRPNTENDPEDCLHPDIEVYTTIQDILNGRDPQIEKLIEIVKNNK
ncbi:S41 family peptidase [Caloranaerobacter azorensis]|uniref:S41 family peptidase n=1 Tax=Caloranaerobacter azorensis TaxID=116090 RepID=UPI0009DED28C|nr:S41 family peptidase [Caloranaerobacter azorensis]